jgi:hypothetical protein
MTLPRRHILIQAIPRAAIQRTAVANQNRCVHDPGAGR